MKEAFFRQSIIKQLLFTVSAVIFGAFASSCQMTDYEDIDTNGSSISFELSTITDGGEAVLTRSVAEASGTSFVFDICCSEEETSAYLATRAITVSSVTDESFSTNGFGLYGFNATGSKVIDGASVSVSGTKGTPDTEYKWKNGANMTFVAFFPKSETIFGSASASGSWNFSYTVPETAVSQKDLMLSYYSGVGAEGTASLSFTHPLTCIKFKLGNIQDKIGNISSIKLTGVYSSGTCTVTPSGSSLSYAWAGSGSTTVSATEEVTPEVGKALGDEYTFIVVPQNLASDNVTVQMTSTKGDTFSFKLSSGEWKAGKTNTYTLSAKFDCSIEVDDDVKTVVKSNVVIKNTGAKDAYVRASIIGNWTDSDGNIVAPWNSTDYVADFTGLCGYGWEYNSTDGYYYYNTKVTPNQELKTANGNQLFDTYTVHTFPSGATQLQLIVLVQAIKYDSTKTYKTVWN